MLTDQQLAPEPYGFKYVAVYEIVTDDISSGLDYMRRGKAKTSRREDLMDQREPAVKALFFEHIAVLIQSNKHGSGSRVSASSRTPDRGSGIAEN